MTIPAHTEAAATGVLRIPTAFVNVYALGSPGGVWVLVDTGLPGAEAYLKTTLEQEMGGPPAAIVLTHGHFDHASNAFALANAWDVTIYAHRAELPFLTGVSDYPPADSSMGGAIAQLARAFPHTSFNFGARVQQLPADHVVPHLPDWRWVETPGHTSGHISLWRDSDKVLVAGDALATMDLDSWLTQVTHERKFARPPVPFTPDWDSTAASIAALAKLEPRVIGAGHGRVMSGDGLSAKLHAYAAVDHRPLGARYSLEPARYDDETGLTSVPPPVEDKALWQLLGGVALVGLAVLVLRRK